MRLFGKKPVASASKVSSALYKVWAERFDYAKDVVDLVPEANRPSISLQLSVFRMAAARMSAVRIAERNKSWSLVLNEYDELIQQANLTANVSATELAIVELLQTRDKLNWASSWLNKHFAPVDLRIALAFSSHFAELIRDSRLTVEDMERDFAIQELPV